MRRSLAWLTAVCLAVSVAGPVAAVDGGGAGAAATWVAGAAPARTAVAARRTVRGPAPKMRPARPVVGTRVRVTGRASRATGRPVRLQHRVNGIWKVVARTRTAKRGTYRFTTTVRAASRYRVLAPATRARPEWRSAVRRIVPRRTAVELSVSGVDFAELGEAVTLVAGVAPVRKRRPVLLERAVPGGWTPVGRVRQGGTADVALRLSGADLAQWGPGEHRLRVRVAATASTRAARATHSLRLLAAPEPDPLVRGEVPRLDITTEGGAEITSGTDYVHSVLDLDTSGARAADGQPLPEAHVGARLRVRGNSTSWIRVKLPYKIKLDQRTSLLGMPASKDYVLLANFYDRSLLRNNAAFAAARRIGMPWAPRMYDVEVWLNGEFKGLYQLGEGVEVEPGRVDLGSADLPEDDARDGGYLLEADAWDDDDPRFRTDRGLQLYVKEPGDVGEEYVAQVRAHIQEFEDALYGPDFTDAALGYRRFVDLAAFADWYLLMELTKNGDSNFMGSVWIKRDLHGRIAMGPPWDFDVSAGIRTRYGVSDPEGWYMHAGPRAPGVERPPSMMSGPEGHWLNRMLEDPVFVALVQQRWRHVSPRLHALPRHLAREATHIATAADRNFAPEEQGGAGFPLTPTFLDGDDVLLDDDTWHAHADRVVGWYAGRVAWLDLAIPRLTAAEGGAG
jgi:hypothetical protein